jgi:hypothetical protein
MEVIEILKQCTIEDTVVKLPNITLSREDYLEIKKALELCGGKWKSGKIQGFVFEENPDYLIDLLLSGKQVNLKKEYQAFFTPKELADQVIDLASFNWHETPSKILKSRILEPSAGRGALVNALRDRHRDIVVDCYELMDLNASYLKRNVPNANIIGDDFLNHDVNDKYDCIVANPPFSKNQDIIHVTKMIEICKEGGNVVSVMSNHWRNCANKKEKAFRDLLEQYDHDIIDIPAGSFKESGTNIACCIVVINK